MRSPTNKSNKKKRKLEASEARRNVQEALLAERLELDEDWIMRWERDGKWREESLAPAELPPCIRANIEQRLKEDDPEVSDRLVEADVNMELASVNEDIDRLVDAGGRRPVLYFCLEKLGPAAEEFRTKGWRDPVPIEYGEYTPSSGEELKRPTSEEIEVLVHKIEAAKEAISRYRGDLLFMYNALERYAAATKDPDSAASWRWGNTAEPKIYGPDDSMPPGLRLGAEDPEDALALLEDSLAWVARLAGAYFPPYESHLMKSKGLLFLTAYVEKYALPAEIRGRGWGGDNVLAGLAYHVTGKEWDSSDLREKLTDFRRRYPNLQKLLIKKLKDLHDFHETR